MGICACLYACAITFGRNNWQEIIGGKMTRWTGCTGFNIQNNPPTKVQDYTDFGLPAQMTVQKLDCWAFKSE